MAVKSILERYADNATEIWDNLTNAEKSTAAHVMLQAKRLGCRGPYDPVPAQYWRPYDR